MARGIKVRLNRAGARAILTSDAVKADLMARAERIAARANGMVSQDKMRNDAFRASDASSPNRARAHVYTASPHGINAQNKDDVLLEDSILLKSLDAGR
ncbi:MAG TPA: hypothetical protein IAA15_02670 [Candidatus Olsenella pullicola]|nr:hypothetical protein [Candidatus Olsenella pullicola]